MRWILEARCVVIDSPTEMKALLKDAIVRKRAGLPPSIPDEEIIERALAMLDQPSPISIHFGGCDCDCHDEED